MVVKWRVRDYRSDERSATAYCFTEFLQMAHDTAGRFFSTDHNSAARVGIAKATLRRILTTPLTDKQYPTAEEQQWAAKIMESRPGWAEATLRACGV